MNHRESIGKRKNPSESIKPLKTYTIPDGASVPSEFIENPTQQILGESFFMKNTNIESSDDEMPDLFSQKMNKNQSVSDFSFQQTRSNNQPDDITSYNEYVQQVKQKRIQDKVDNITKKLDLLLKSTILTKEIQIADDLVFTIRNLKNEDQANSILESVGSKYQIQESLSIRDGLVARSIHKVSGLSIKDIFEEDSIDNRMFLVKKLDDKIVSRLHQEVLIFQEECEKKYGVKSSKDFDEIIAQIKKA